MWTDAHLDRSAFPAQARVRDRARARGRPARRALVGLTAVALLASAAIATAPAAFVEPDLARVIRFMALIKGGFALAALAGCFWRLARPAGTVRTAIYVAAPPAMAAGALALGSLHSPALAAAGLHLGLLAVLAAALTDSEFLPDRPRHR
ncbi:hypothetical protein [Methylobacterium sp. E-046]|uniref:hypothetical protein n=1 Tax=Methylobacterium sp. E-046 TaxID=2836576 RepID=UPI001FB87743|nr:hypothetical protein [Methylobacterium sp. E-046]MCJ2098027.1 hypothetical protein [Methylobacterium sp. E-046]